MGETASHPPYNRAWTIHIQRVLWEMKAKNRPLIALEWENPAGSRLG